MLRKNQNIKVFDGNSNNLKFDISIVTEVEITSKRNEYTDTARVVFPNKLGIRSNAISQFKIGDKIEIRLGYFPNLTLEFIGYINYVNKDSPLVLECEDESFLLKRKSLEAKNFPTATIKQIIEFYYTGPTEIVDAQLGDVRINQGATLIAFLDLLKTKYEILSFFQQGILKINTSLIEENTERTFLINEQINVPMGTTDLQFQKDSDLPIISHGLSVQKGGGKIELFARYRDNVLNSEIIVSEIAPLGTLNTFKVPNLTKEVLRGHIVRRLPLLFYTGATGTVTTFGEPSIRHGDTVHYVDDRIPDKSGFYRVNEVVKKFTVDDGYRQIVTLGLKVKN